MSYYDDMTKQGRQAEIGREPRHFAKPDLSYMADELRPVVQGYLDKMRALADRSAREGNQSANSLANRAYAAAMDAISEHRWPLST